MAEHMAEDQQATGGPASQNLVSTLLELARSAAEDPLQQVLESVGQAILTGSGYGVVVLNVFRPAWDDYEAILVFGRQESSDTLIGTTAVRDVVERLIATGDQLLAGTYLLTGDSPVWQELQHVYTPPHVDSPDPGAWQAEDALLIMLSDAAGGPLGFVSVDEPTSGRRPADSELRILRSVCSYAEQALRSAQRSLRAEDDKRLLQRLSEISPRLSRCQSRDELYGLVTTVVVADLGFERVGLFIAGRGELLEMRQSRGWSEVAGSSRALDRHLLEHVLASSPSQSGCWLAHAHEVWERPPDAARRSSRNGVGARAWSDHVLLVPWRDDSGQLFAVLAVEDPTDRLRPSAERCRAARLLVDLAAAVARSLEQQERLVRQAAYDALTGVRNRRGLYQLITGCSRVAVLVCDLDHFKNINDTLGHDLGDQVLGRFGSLLNEVAVGCGVPFRLGGEEFCLVIPGADVETAGLMAERLRASTSDLGDLVPGGVTVSIGVAATSGAPAEPKALLAAADRALYAAKRAGRDRVVVAAATDA